MPALITAIGLGKTYYQGGTKIEAVKDLNLTVEKGSCVGIIGPSGAGKSTLLHMLGGLDRPSQGKVLYENKELFKLNDRERSKLRNKKIGFVFQFYNLLAEFSVLENVVMPGLIHNEPRLSKHEIRNRASHILDNMGLGKRLSHKPGMLSGGEAQRVAVARALINDPDVILCDEPTGNLDSNMSEEIYGIIRSMGKERKMSIVIVTHHEYRACSFDKIYHIRDGMVV